MQDFAHCNAPQIYLGPMAMIISCCMGRACLLASCHFGSGPELGTE
jgi:hypothetical protein